MANQKKKDKKPKTNNQNPTGVKKNTAQAKIIHIHNHNNQKTKKFKSRNMVTQVPINGLRNGFPKQICSRATETEAPTEFEILKTKSINICTEDVTTSEVDTLASLFNSFMGRLITVNFKIDSFIRAKDQTTLTSAREVLILEFGDNFQSKKDFSENISLGLAGYITFEYIVWKGYHEFKLNIDDIMTSKYTQFFLKNYFIPGS